MANPPRSKVTSDTIVGLFVILGILSMVLLTFVIRQDIVGSTVRITVTFQSVSGLEVGAPVLVSGIREGRVSDIDYVEQPGPEDPARPEQPVLVTMVIDDDIPIYTNANINLVQQGFIGDKRVEIDPGSPEGGTLVTEADMPLRSEPFFDTGEVLRKAEAIVTDLQATVSSFREFTTDDENIAQIRDTIRNLNQSVQRVSVYLEQNEEDVRASMENMREITADIREVSERARVLTAEGGRVDELTGEAQMTLAEVREESQALIARANSAIERIETTVGDVDARTETLAAEAVTTMTQAREDWAALSENLQVTSANLNDLLVSVRRGEGTVGMLMTDPQPFEDLRDSLSALQDFISGRGRAASDLRYELPRQPAAPNE